MQFKQCNKQAPVKVSSLPGNFAEQVAELEKQFKKSSLSIEGIRNLLVLYQTAKEYYVNRKEKIKNDYHSKYLYVLNHQYTKQLLTAKSQR